VEQYFSSLNVIDPKEWFPAAFKALRHLTDDAWYLEGELPASTVYMHCPAVDPETGGRFLEGQHHDCSEDHDHKAWGAAGTIDGDLLGAVPSMIRETLPEAFIVLSVGKYIEVKPERGISARQTLIDTYGSDDPNAIPESAFRTAVLLYGMDGRYGKQQYLVASIIDDNALVWSDEKAFNTTVEALRENAKSIIGDLSEFKNWPVANFED
jgi:hypothetical protein